MYRGSPGMLAWALHRITGVAVLLFLFAHIIETSMLNVSPEAYNRAISLYRQAWFKPSEFIGLVFMALGALVLFVVHVPGGQ